MTMVDETAQQSGEAAQGNADASETTANEYKQKGNQCFKGSASCSKLTPQLPFLQQAAIDHVATVVVCKHRSRQPQNATGWLCVIIW